MDTTRSRLLPLVALGCALVVSACGSPTTGPGGAAVTGTGAHFTVTVPDGFTDLRAADGDTDADTYSQFAVGDPSGMDGIKIVETATTGPGAPEDSDMLAEALAQRLGATAASATTTTVGGLPARSYAVSGTLNGRIVLVDDRVKLSILCLAADDRAAVDKGCDAVLSSLRVTA